MGKKDVYTSPYFANKERIAELINVNLYKGEKVVLAQNLKRLAGCYPSVGSVSGKKQRDLLFEEETANIRYGIELETKEDYSMPERIMIYDVSDYEDQIQLLDRRHRKNGEYITYEEKKSRMKKSDSLLPIITMVLYLGEDKWNGPKRLSEMCGLSDGDNLRQLIQDYQIFVVETDAVNALDYETDLREFFEVMQCRKNKKELQKLFQSERFQKLSKETELAIAVNLNWKGFITKVKEEEISMCQAIEEWRIELIEEGEEIGKEIGDSRRVLMSIESIIEKMKVSLSDACDMIGISVEEFERAKKIQQG